MTDSERAARIVLRSAALLEKSEWQRSTRFGTKPTEYWTTPRNGDGATKVWIRTTDYPAEVGIRVYFASIAQRDNNVSSLKKLPPQDLMAHADIAVGTSKDKNPDCRYYLKATLKHSALADLPASMTDPNEVAAALCSALVPLDGTT